MFATTTATAAAEHTECEKDSGGLGKASTPHDCSWTTTHGRWLCSSDDAGRLCLTLEGRGPSTSTQGYLDWSAFGRLRLPTVSTLTRLSLSDQGLSCEALPESLWNISGLEVLDLSRNSLCDLSEKVGNLGALRVLDISRNLLRELPVQLGQLGSLVALHVQSNQLRPFGRSIPTRELATCKQLSLMDLRFNDKLKSKATLEALTAALPGVSRLWITVKRRGGATGSTAARELDASLLRSQLKPWSTPHLRKRLAEEFGVTTSPDRVGRERVMALLLESYERAGAAPRPERHVRGGTSLRPDLASQAAALLSELRRTFDADAPAQERPKVRASGYICLDKVGLTAEADGASSTMAEQRQRPLTSDSLSKKERRRRHAKKKGATKAVREAAAKLSKHRKLWDLAAIAIAETDAAFAAEYTTLAVSWGFVGSPHIDTYDISPQYALSLGDFAERGGGELCVEEEGALRVAVVDTHSRMAKVDGRFPHWVRPYEGERFSMIWFKTSGDVVPPTKAVFD